MCQLVESRPEAEMAAAEALLILAGVFARRNEPSTQNATANVPSKGKLHPKQRLKAGLITSTPTQPGRDAVFASFASFEPNQTRQSVILSVNCNGQVEKCADSSTPQKSPAQPKIENVSTATPALPVLPSKSKSGRVVRRTKRFISLSDEENTPPNDGKKTTMPLKRAKPEDKNISKNNDEIHPAKKLKAEPTSKPKNTSIINVNSMMRPKVDIFSKNAVAQIQSDLVRHSRLSEIAYEMQHCTQLYGIVDVQVRAAEQLVAYKSEIDAKRNQMLSNRSSKMTELMQKFRGIKNRQQVCDEFTSKFATTTSTQWKPFTEDSARSANIADYKVLQVTKRPLIKFLVDEFVRQNHTKERARALLIEVFKLLPNRPEVRHEFINVHLPKVVAANKQSNKRNKSQNIKKEIAEINPAFQYYF